MRSWVSSIILAVFLVNTFLPPSYAQVLMPPPVGLVALSPAFHPPIFTGVKVYAKDPFRFDFILDKGDEGETLHATSLQEESSRLVKYFLAALTVPAKELWVNLSPYEKDRIVPEAFGRTEMGRDLLAQDYLLKQITSSLMYPEQGLGKKFWAEIYKQAREKFGTTDIPVDTFNKVWIVPAKAVVYEKPKVAGKKSPEEAVAYVVESRLKVMLDVDYTASMRADIPARGTDARSAPTTENDHAMGVGADFMSARGEMPRQILRQIIIPVLEKEINEGKNFAQLRQVYNSLILATWYKKKVMGALKDSPLGFYVGQNKVQGVNIDDPKEAEKIWSRYVEAFQKGAYNFIREELDPATHETVPRKYFAGGVQIVPDLEMTDHLDAAALTPKDAFLVEVQGDGIPVEKEQGDHAEGFKNGLKADVLLGRSPVWAIFREMNKGNDIPVFDIEQDSTSSERLQSEILRRTKDLHDDEFVGLDLVINDPQKDWTHYLTIVGRVGEIKRGSIFTRQFDQIDIGEQEFVHYCIVDRRNRNVHLKRFSLGKGAGNDVLRDQGLMKPVFVYREELFRQNFPRWGISVVTKDDKIKFFMSKFNARPASDEVFRDFVDRGYEPMILPVEGFGFSTKDFFLLGSIPESTTRVLLQDDMKFKPRGVKPVKALVFDLADTLYASELVKKLKVEALVRFCLMNKEGVVEKDVRDKYAQLDSLSGVVGAYGLDMVAFNKVIDDLDIGSVGLEPNDALVALLKNLRRSYYLVLASNASDAHVQQVLQALGLAESFDRVYTQGSMGVGKPDPRFFDHIVNALGFPPEAVVSIGGSLEKEVNAARAAGLKAIHVDGVDDLMDNIVAGIEKINADMAQMLPAEKTPYKEEEYISRSFGALNYRYNGQLTRTISSSIVSKFVKDRKWVAPVPVKILFVGVGRGLEAIEAQRKFGRFVDVYAVNKEDGLFYDKESFLGSGGPVGVFNRKSFEKAFEHVKNNLRIVDLDNEMPVFDAKFDLVVLGYVVTPYFKDPVGIFNTLLEDYCRKDGNLLTFLTDRIQLRNYVSEDNGSADASRYWSDRQLENNKRKLDKFFREFSKRRQNVNVHFNFDGSDVEWVKIRKNGQYRIPLKFLGATRDAKINVPKYYSFYSEENLMQVAADGGIDLNPVDHVMTVGTSEGSGFFHFDPAALEKYRGAAGIAPVILSIRPVNDLAGFLGAY